jgi:flagellar transcriptional activator FlhC
MRQEHPHRSAQIERAVTLINLGARLQVLESETDLSYERLLRLYKEVAGKSPSKGQLPFSTDWFMTWQPNIHASLFLNIHEYLNKVAELDEIDVVIKAYQLYLEQVGPGPGAAAVVTRAWRLVKFVDNGMLRRLGCIFGVYIVHGGNIQVILQALPFEMITIFGRAMGAFLANNQPKVVKASMAAFASCFKGSKYTKARYMELLALLYDILQKARKEGLMSIEKDVENPQRARDLFKKYPTWATTTTSSSSSPTTCA